LREEETFLITIERRNETFHIKKEIPDIPHWEREAASHPAIHPATQPERERERENEPASHPASHEGIQPFSERSSETLLIERGRFSPLRERDSHCDRVGVSPHRKRDGETLSIERERDYPH